MAVSASNAHEYYGYSTEVYDGFVLHSQYIEMHDGTKLAIDIYRPTLHNKLHTEKLPVIWTSTTYSRARVADNAYGRTMLSDNTFFAGRGHDGIEKILRHGYVIAVLDARGSGASFGFRTSQPTYEDMNDLYDVNEWLAAQPWCCGKTGMFGTSFLGQMQWRTALMGAPSLKCIVPVVGAFEYPTMVMNGIWNTGWINHWNTDTTKNHINAVTAPVEEDTDGSMLAAANEEHKKAPNNMIERAEAKYMDSYSPALHRRLYQETYFPYRLAEINSSGVACYIWGGLMDFQAFGSFQWYTNLKVPKKMLIWSGVHTSQFLPENPDWTIEHLRWYDYWLKGIENGIMDEPPIMIQHSKIPTDDKTVHWNSGLDYELGGAYPCPFFNCEKVWKTYDAFPPRNMKYKKYYFTGGKSGSVDSINDGMLVTHSSQEVKSKDKYTVDYSISQYGYYDRNMFFVKNISVDNTPNDEKSLTYTTPPMAHDLEMTGFPVVRMWVDSNSTSVDFFVMLEEVDQEGNSWLLTDGRIRAGFRCMQTPPFDNMGLPWHRYNKSDLVEMPCGQPVRMEFALNPLSCTVVQGNRIRVTVNNFDAEDWDTPVVEPAPSVHIYHEIEHDSFVELPVICC